jgi:PAS domain S-box-containing protein
LQDGEFGDIGAAARFQDRRELVAVLSPDGRVRHISDSVTDLLGHGPEALTGAALDTHIHPDDVEEARFRLRLRTNAPAGSSGRAAFRFRHADGGWRWLEVTARNELVDPAIGGLMLNIRDISDHIALSERLRASEARYRTLAETVLVGILQADAGGQVLFANARLAGITGLEPDRLLGEGWLNAVHPEDRARVAADWRLDSGGESVATDFRFHDPDGTGADRRVLCQRIRLEDGGTIATITDVSEYVHTANVLRLSEARNEAILDTAADAILTIDEAGVLISFNRAAEAMFGIAAADLLWRPLDRLIPLANLREEGGGWLEFAPDQTTALVARDRAAEAERADGTRFSGRAVGQRQRGGRTAALHRHSPRRDRTAAGGGRTSGRQRGGGGREPREIDLHRRHEPRTAHPAERGDRLLTVAGGAGRERCGGRAAGRLRRCDPAGWRTTAGDHRRHP